MPNISACGNASCVLGSQRSGDLVQVPRERPLQMAQPVCAITVDFSQELGLLLDSIDFSRLKRLPEVNTKTIL